MVQTYILRIYIISQLEKTLISHKTSELSADTIENNAAALCNMIGEVIGTIAYLNAFLIGSQNVYFTGRTSYLSEVVNGINARLDLAGIKGQYNNNREYANVIGVLKLIKNL